VITTSATHERAQAASEPETFAIDGARSSIGFRVSFLGLHTVRGRFRTVSGTIRQCPDARRCGVEVRVEIASIATLIPLRDRHLRSAHYFDAKRFPEMVFRARTIERRDSGIVVVGPLTIRDVTREIEVTMNRLQAQGDGDGNGVAGRIRFRGRFELDRTDFGVRGIGLFGIADRAIGRIIGCEVDIEAVR
jgi:polyisoprenoid-binding protein YceI